MVVLLHGPELDKSFFLPNLRDLNGCRKTVTRLMLTAAVARAIAALTAVRAL